MASKTYADLIEAFSEVKMIGRELAEKINEWNENELDDANVIGDITPDASGDAVVLRYTEHNYNESIVGRMLRNIGFTWQEDLDDRMESELHEINNIGENVNNFLEQCIAVSNAYPYFVKKIELQSGNAQRREEVRIIIPSDSDFRKMSSTQARKVLFMHFLKDIREQSTRFDMIDETLCFCPNRKEFLIVFRPLPKKTAN